ncbi:MAG: hypothetical protein IJ297_06625, partial [Clostridia bacterium]|nr:hypothetical protein [Clostridia bacterium]
MFKKIVLIVLAFTLALGCTNAKAAGFVTNSITDLSMDAQHYYHTKVDYADMVVTHVDDELYEVLHYTQSGKMLKLQLYKTAWGTWNLGDFSLVDNTGIQKTVIGGGTDWEYVFRVFNPITQNLEFTGGNHGSEVCSSLVMYDSVTGLAVNPAIGESMYVNRLVIEEDTTILLANVDYLPYANVKRVYTVVGDRVNLDCKVTFTRD